LKKTSVEFMDKIRAINYNGMHKAKTKGNVYMGLTDTLNKEQKEAVLHTEGPLLILAGAGSGKTRVLTYRIAYLIGEKKVEPWNILAITFTNKAAGEMRERVDRIAGAGAAAVWVSTFHALCVRILRRYIEELGYTTSFTIYDSDDQKNLMKQVLHRLDIDTKSFPERKFLSSISRAKDEMISPDTYRKNSEGDMIQEMIARVYRTYEDELKKSNALDFDDLLLQTVRLFEKCPQILEQYQERFRYIMVDEYQDTNTVQFRLVSLLAGKYRNLCVVGDDDQSIYRFRGANIRNILNFEKEYKGAKTIKLEQNYRSTEMILGAANEVISNNKGRKPKTLWTDNGTGEPVVYKEFGDAYQEAEYIVGDIARNVRCHACGYNDNAILYRTNAQSRLFEEKFIGANIPYKIIGGINFYSRREVKDLLAYLKTVDNGADDLAVLRIINVPKRGIGQTTVSRIQAYAAEHDMRFYDAMREASDIPGVGRGLSKIKEFADCIETLKAESAGLSVSELLSRIIDMTGYEKELEAEATEDAQARIDNIEELRSKAVSYEMEAEGDEASLRGFLEEVALVADIDTLDESQDYVALMTLHSAKGLEFPYVYMSGMEEGMFPGYMSITSDDPAELEEERRLCYVGITRAKQHLTMTSARSRMLHGQIQYNAVSRFIKEISAKYLDGTTGFVKLEDDDINIPKREQRQTVQEFRKKPYVSQYSSPYKKEVPKTLKGTTLPYDVGDQVRHMKFGEGTVTGINDMGRDYEVTVDFQKAGVKKMFAAFAKLQKIES